MTGLFQRLCDRRRCRVIIIISVPGMQAVMAIVDVDVDVLTVMLRSWKRWWRSRAR
jgi:hypothetical protein